MRILILTTLLSVSFGGRLLSATIPAGTELNIRLTDKISTQAPEKAKTVHAILIAPIMLNGAIVLPAGAELTGEIKSSTSATDKDTARLELTFNSIASGSYH